MSLMMRPMLKPERVERRRIGSDTLLISLFAGIGAAETGSTVTASTATT